MSPSLSSRTQRPLSGAALPKSPQLLSSLTSLIVALSGLAILFAVYRSSLDFQFILDDHRFIGDPRIQFSGHLWDYFSNFVWAQFTGGPPSFYRPLFLVWLRANFLIAGLSTWGWHLLSIAKHAMAAALLGLLAWELLADRMAALAVAVLFALHPAQVESVAWVTVPDPLLAICVFCALFFWLKYEESFPSEPLPGKRSRPLAKPGDQPSARWLAASVIAAFAAMLAKETAIVLPAILLALSLWAPPQNSPAATKTPKREDSRFRSFFRALRLTAPFFAVTVLYLLLRLHALAGKLGSRTQDLPWSTVVLSWPATLWFYLKVLFWPAHSYAFADPTLVANFSARGVLLPAFAVLCLIALFGGTIHWAWRKSVRSLPRQDAAKIKSALLLGSLLLVLPLLLTLDLNALNPGDFLHGRYTYLPLAGLLLLAATAWHLAGRMRIPLLCAAAALAAGFAALTVSQEKQWADDLTVFTVAHQLAPSNAPVAQNLANAHVQQALQWADDGRCGEALPVFRQVTEQYREDWFAWAGLGDCLAQLDQLPQAEQALHRAADLAHDPRITEQWQQLRIQMGLAASPPQH